MYTIRYEKYYNDYRKSQEVKTFRSLEEVADSKSPKSTAITREI